MLVLALDSAGSACSAAVLRDGVVVARRRALMARGQSEVLVPMVGDVMKDAGLTFDHLDLLAASVGPGAFTGIRIGLATARALALAAAKPLAGIRTTDAIAAATDPDQRRNRLVMVVMESRRAELWVQCYDDTLTALGPIQALTPQQAAAVGAGAVLLAGDGAGLVAPLLPQAMLAHDCDHVDAVQVARLAAQGWPDAVLPPEPLYLRDADVTLACA
ncbi:putative peptidase [Magnetospirillum gryphiswaldense MSR-1 v2]|uniref:Peptidase n=1 Tax=Magnetospirillum gryphiswaldense (strain DSM 6361 / JCM 21280 / NBRC 15271 / MSR-1) TaxID=431944 RepID=V6F7R1_MAGGM|nr:tRNA (adenosine(37)-N6)-threonylcarbamoyltransferase complex dimerization subunit type 1 TsaB [Magnetospirillum gryphiswaldense]CDL00331.1 putative peptidase [Magnetospirillum gryphiswaldense MSR-1 v2]